ncbi:MAG: serine hydrolase [FCB group bacterium]|nr:serine hydrolase [FCB group bacterium]MBL7029315.1 serine hydrolase [Candidatus Neomarinimicrobiota bacterium]MBL7122637.1 serine hydrolase [Candidatus Neomarinimicrobiota bacterium]
MKKTWLVLIHFVIVLVLISCSGLKKTDEVDVPHVVGIAYMNLETGEILAYNAHELFHAASTMKTPVMFQLFKMRDKGIIDLKSEIPVRNQFTSIVDGSLFSLPIESEKDEILYPFLNQNLSFYDIIEKMITHSSNLATNILIEHTGADSIGATMRMIEADGVLVMRGVEDLKAYSLGLNNVTSAYGMMKVMEAVYKSDLVADSSRQEMQEILKRQHFNTMIPAGLPKDVIIAHKTGSITRIAHDAALVFPPDSPPFVLVILTRGWDDHASAQKVGARISSKVYDYHRGLLKRTDIAIPDLLKDE